MMVLWRYMGFLLGPYMSRRDDVDVATSDDDVPFTHDPWVGDHVIRWKMLAYLYPI